jgi:hypothetical protein
MDRKISLGSMPLLAALLLPPAGCGVLSGSGEPTVAVDLQECADWTGTKLPELTAALLAEDAEALENMARSQGLGFIGCLVERAIFANATSLSKLSPPEQAAALRLLDVARAWLADHGLRTTAL